VFLAAFTVCCNSHVSGAQVIDIVQPRLSHARDCPAVTSWKQIHDSNLTFQLGVQFTSDFHRKTGAQIEIVDLQTSDDQEALIRLVLLRQNRSPVGFADIYNPETSTYLVSTPQSPMIESMTFLISAESSTATDLQLKHVPVERDRRAENNSGNAVDWVHRNKDHRFPQFQQVEVNCRDSKCVVEFDALLTADERERANSLELEIITLSEEPYVCLLLGLMPLGAQGEAAQATVPQRYRARIPVSGHVPKSRWIVANPVKDAKPDVGRRFHNIVLP